MKTLKIAWMLGVGFCMSALAEGDRSVEGEEVPEFLMQLKDLSNAEEAMILEALGLMKGKDGELESAKGDDLIEVEVFPRGAKVEVERLFSGGKGGVPRLRDRKAFRAPEEVGSRWMIGAVIEPDEKGVLVVRRVMAGSPSEKAGMKQGDRLQSINGIKLRDFEMLTGLIQLVRDQEVIFNVVRGDQKKKLKVKAHAQVHLQHESEELEQVEELVEEKEKVDVKRLPTRRPVWDGRKEREFRALQDEFKRLKQRVEKLEK